MEFDSKGRIDTQDSGREASHAAPLRSLDSRDLLAGDREIMIQHGESTYRLRSTNKGKLILTK